MTVYPVWRISDHALVRFIERAGGFDLNPLRAQIETSLNRAFTVAEKVGADSFTIRADGLLYVVKNGTLVTIQDDRGQIIPA
jgi:hypothetical protein